MKPARLSLYPPTTRRTESLRFWLDPQGERFDPYLRLMRFARILTKGELLRVQVTDWIAEPCERGEACDWAFRIGPALRDHPLDARKRTLLVTALLEAAEANGEMAFDPWPLLDWLALGERARALVAARALYLPDPALDRAAFAGIARRLLVETGAVKRPGSAFSVRPGLRDRLVDDRVLA